MTGAGERGRALAHPAGTTPPDYAAIDARGRGRTS